MPGRRRTPRPGAVQAENGAVAVEFALVLPLLMMFLFGVIQYGYGLFQLQSFTSAVGDSARVLATGIDSCTGYASAVRGLVQGDGLDPADVGTVDVQWINSDGSALAQRLGYARVTVSYTPFKIGLPFIPFPSRFTRSQTVMVQDIGLPSLPGCEVPLS